MATNNPNSNYTVDMEVQEQSLEKNQQLQYFLFRIFPFWPLIFLALALGISAGYVFLRYATPIYQVKARVVVNDDSQQKSANLQEIIKLDTRNLSSEAEREIEILKSTNLLRKVVSQLQLNVRYGQQGNIKSGQAYYNIPFKLELENPDSIKSVVSGEVKVTGKQIEFNGKVYPVDTFVGSYFGNIRWHINQNYRAYEGSGKWLVTVSPVSPTARQIKGGLSVVPISKQSSILDIGYIDPFPDRAVQIINTLISVYGSSLVDYKSRIYENTQHFLDGRLNLVSEELTGVEKRLQAYKTSAHIIDLSSEGSLYLGKLKAADTKISELEVQMEILGSIENYVNRRNNENNAIPATLGISDPVLLALLNQLYQAEFELEKIKQTSGEKNPQIEVYEQLIAKLKPSILVSINNLKMNLLTNKRKLESVNAEITSTLSRIPEKERALLDISRQQGIKNAIYTFLLQKKEESAIAAASIVENYRVIERAEVGQLIAPNRQNYFALSIVVALLLAVFYIYLKEFANSRLLFRSQIENRLPLPIIAELVFKPNPSGNPIVVGEGKRTLIAEQFRELRTNLSFVTAASDKINQSKVILITSSIPSEGKSFVAINTSVSLCLTGAKVVLLEFDLRKPKISKPLGIKREPGITNYLIGNAKETDIIQQHSEIANFHIIASGPVPPNPAELIGSAKMKDLVDYLRMNFDYIIVDSPPVASVTDAKLLAAFADVTLYIIRHNFTNGVFLKAINDIYQKKTMPNMNIVFNGIINKKVLGYGYGKGYGYGYGYAYGNGYGYGYTEDESEQSWFRKKWNRIFKKK
jgi:tyrosine-protein kinase Etk/Wzc